MRAESHQANVLGIPFFNVAEVPGKLQSFGGGGLVSVSERAAGTGEPDRPCGLNSFSCLTGCCCRGFIYLFLGVYIQEVKSDMEISGLCESLCIRKQ